MSTTGPSPADLTALDAALGEAASSPAAASNETGSVSSRSIAELIALDRYQRSKAALAAGKGWGMRVTRLEPGEAT
jgi:hypothetical protein